MGLKTAFTVLLCVSRVCNAIPDANRTLGFGVIDDGDAPDSTECREYHSIKNATEICIFVNTTDDCQIDEGFVNYIDYALCKVESKMLPGVYVLFTLWLLYLFIALGTTAESFFCPALEFIAHNLKLSQNIAGITVVAFGNGAPDIFSAIAAFTHSNPSSSGVAIGALLGAGVFVTTVVAGSVSISTQFDLAQRPFLRDVTFYLATVFWTFYLLYKGEIDLINSVGFLLLYVVYVIVVLTGRYINQRLRSTSNSNPEAKCDENSPLLNGSGSDSVTLGPTDDEDDDWVSQPLRAAHEHDKVFKEGESLGNINASDKKDLMGETKVTFTKFGKFLSLINPVDAKEWKTKSLFFKIVEVLQAPIKLLCYLTVPVISADPDVNDWSRSLACLHCITSPLFCVFAAEGAFVKIRGILPLWALFLIVGIALAAIVFFTSKEMERPKYYWLFAYIGFVASVVWTYCIANEIVNLLQTFGALLDVSNVIMGLTLLAWGNSIGDCVADVTLAKQGFPRMAISACFGGPFFNLAIGIGLPCLIANISSGRPVLVKFTLLEAFLIGSLLFSLCFSYIVVPLRKFKLTRIYGIVLIVIYLVYLPLVLLAGVGVI